MHACQQCADLTQQLEKLRAKLSPNHDPEFAAELAEKLREVPLESCARKVRRKLYIAVTPGDIFFMCFGKDGNLREVAETGRSLQALGWERTAIHGKLTFIKPIAEYEADKC